MNQQINQTQKKLETLIYQLANLHTNKTGKYDRAKELYNQYLIHIKNLDPYDIAEKSSLLKIKFHIYKNLSSINEKTKAIQQWRESLQKAQYIHQELYKLIAKQKNVIEQIKNKLLKTKKLLINDTKRKSFNKYLEIQGELKQAKSLLATLESVNNSLPLKKIYFALARYWEQKHGYAQALEVYRAAERMGIRPDEARRHMNRIRRR